jgi:hypothetical protein
VNDVSTNHRAENLDLDAAARTPDHVVFRAFVNETVLLNLETGLYHGVNPTGGRMLETIVGSDSLRDASTRLAQHYGVPVEQIERDLRTFCVDLEDRGLLVLQPADSG